MDDPIGINNINKLTIAMVILTTDHHVRRWMPWSLPPSSWRMTSFFFVSETNVAPQKKRGLFWKRSEQWKKSMPCLNLKKFLNTFKAKKMDGHFKPVAKNIEPLAAPACIMHHLNSFVFFHLKADFSSARWCPRGGGNWGTLRIPRKDWGTLGKIRGITSPP